MQNNPDDTTLPMVPLFASSSLGTSAPAFRGSTDVPS